MDGRLRERVSSVAGREVTDLTPIQGGGYSLALRLKAAFDDGSTAFVKAATTDDTARFLRAERQVYEGLGAQSYLAEYRGFDDDDSRPLLLLEDLTGALWPPPWTTTRIDAVLAALDSLRLAPKIPGLPPLEAHRGSLNSWGSVAAQPGPFLTLGLCSPRWLDRALPDLLAAEASIDLAGDDLLHLDVRSDNLCFQSGGVAALVDWNWACVGNAALDLAGWLPSLHSEGGPLPETLLPEGGVWAAALSGYFAAQAGLPPPDGAPTVRTVQKSQLSSALPWASRALGLDPNFAVQ